MRFAFAILALALVARIHAADVPEIVFPDVDGWAKGQRYDATPGAPASAHTSIMYTTKAKIGGDYIRAEIRLPKTDGKSLKDSLPAFEKTAIDNPVHKNSKKTGTKELTVGKTKITQVTITSTFGGTPNERVMFVFPYGDYFLKIEHAGPSADSAKRSTEAMKLLKAIVEAAEKK